MTKLTPQQLEKDLTKAYEKATATEEKAACASALVSVSKVIEKNKAEEERDRAKMQARREQSLLERQRAEVYFG